MAHHDVQNKILNKTHSEEQREEEGGEGSQGGLLSSPRVKANTHIFVASDKL